MIASCSSALSISRFSGREEQRPQRRGWQPSELYKVGRGEASLAAPPLASGTAAGHVAARSMPRRVFMDDLKIVVYVDFVGRQDAVFAVDGKDGGGGHQVGESWKVRLSDLDSSS